MQALGSPLPHTPRALLLILHMAAEEPDLSKLPHVPKHLMPPPAAPTTPPSLSDSSEDDDVEAGEDRPLLSLAGAKAAAGGSGPHGNFNYPTRSTHGSKPSLTCVVPPW